MTVCVAVRVHDSLIFAADSASTLEARDANGNSTVLNVFQHGDKVFNLRKGLPLAAMTCGMGHIGERAISSLTKDFRFRLTCGSSDWLIDPDDYSVEEVAKKAKAFFFDERFLSLPQPQPTPHLFEFWVGGYDANSERHDLWKLSIANNTANLERLGAPGTEGIRWGGQPEAITRLIKGFDPSLRDALVQAGVSANDATNIDAFIKNNFEVQLYSASMPTQDAIELADFLVQTTKGFARFKFGADTVGGETDLAAVTRHEGFKWIRRKHYYDPSLNPLETDHVPQRTEGKSSIGSAPDAMSAEVSLPTAELRELTRQRNIHRRKKVR